MSVFQKIIVSGPDGGHTSKATLRVIDGVADLVIKVPLGGKVARVQKPTRLSKQIRPRCKHKTRPRKQSKTSSVNSRQGTGNKHQSDSGKSKRKFNNPFSTNWTVWYQTIDNTSRFLRIILSELQTLNLRFPTSHLSRSFILPWTHVFRGSQVSCVTLQLFLKTIVREFSLPKTDDFLENFQTALNPPPPLQVFGDMLKFALFATVSRLNIARLNIKKLQHKFLISESLLGKWGFSIMQHYKDDKLPHGRTISLA